jgi:hypothetical protein
MPGRKQKSADVGAISQGVAILNEFVAACLDDAQQQLCAAGTVKGMANFGYGMRGGTKDPSISQYELTQQDSDEVNQEIEKVKGYARKTGAEAVAVVMDMGADPVSAALYPDSDGVLLVAAVSPEGQVGVMRPYKRSEKRVVFGEPKILESFETPLLEGIFEPEDQREA